MNILFARARDHVAGAGAGAGAAAVAVLLSAPAAVAQTNLRAWHTDGADVSRLAARHRYTGGLARKNRSLSRRSMVTRHIGRSACMYDMNTYFLSPRDAFDKKAALTLGITESDMGAYVRHDKPVTY